MENFQNLIIDFYKKYENGQKKSADKIRRKKLVRLLSRVKLPAPYPVFIVLCKSVPMVAVDIALMKDKDHLFLTYRNDEFYRGWHMPGSILIYHEKPIKTFYRAAKKSWDWDRKI